MTDNERLTVILFLRKCVCAAAETYVANPYNPEARKTLQNAIRDLYAVEDTYRKEMGLDAKPERRN